MKGPVYYEYSFQNRYSKTQQFYCKIYVLPSLSTRFGDGDYHQANPLKISEESKMIK